VYGLTPRIVGRALIDANRREAAGGAAGVWTSPSEAIRWLIGQACRLNWNSPPMTLRARALRADAVSLVSALTSCGREHMPLQALARGSGTRVPAQVNAAMNASPTLTSIAVTGSEGRARSERRRR
jgi:hypothetical protein